MASAGWTILGEGQTTIVIQFLMFFLVGILNTILGYTIIFALMYLMGFNPEFSNLIGYSVALIVSYFLNRKFTFKSTQKRHAEAIKFITAFLIAYAINFIVLVILFRLFNINSALSQIFAGICYVAVSYALNKFYVFKRQISLAK